MGSIQECRGVLTDPVRREVPVVHDPVWYNPPIFGVANAVGESIVDGGRGCSERDMRFGEWFNIVMGASNNKT